MKRFLAIACLAAAGVAGAAAGAAAAERVYWDGPTGAHSGRPPKLVLIYVHGGGWSGFDPAFVNVYRRSGRGLRSIGYATATLDFSAGAAGIDDIQRAYRRIRRRAGAGTPVCALGDSSGGHAALLLAAREPGLDCVVALGAPTDLTDLGDAAQPDTIRDAAERAFGRDRLAQYSPLTHARSIRAKLMLVRVATDPLVGAEQARRLARAVPGTRVLVLPPGGAPFVHAAADEQAIRGYLAARKRFFAAAIRAKG
jgi:acetyl esterase/lipase